MYFTILCTVKLKLQHPPPGHTPGICLYIVPEEGEFERCVGRVGNLNQIYLLF